MAVHHDVGDSPFLKRVLIPFWVVRILFMVLLIALYALSLGVISTFADNLETFYASYGVSFSPSTAIAILAVIMVLMGVCLTLDIVCIIKRANHTLSPRFFLIVNVVQTTIWTVLFILSMIGTKSGLTIGLNIFVFLSFIGLLIYASVIFHQFRNGTLPGKYVRTSNQADSQALIESMRYPVMYNNHPDDAFPAAYSAAYSVPIQNPTKSGVQLQSIPSAPPA